jgi:Arc/MetJ-type ribon-helix-helix transcriptional regulator
MQFILKPEAKQFVEDQIKAGHFQTADDVVNEAVSRMMIENELELDEDTVAAIQRADEQLARGEWIDFDTFAAEMRAKISKQ